MDTGPTCPGSDNLRRHLLGLGEPADAAALDAHLADCPGCAAVAAGLPAEDELVRSIRGAAADPVTLPPLARALVPVFRRLRARRASVGEVETVDAPVVTRPPVGESSAPALGPLVVLDQLGAGGMGVVYRAFDPRLQREVAVKVVRPDLLTGPGVADRFLAEARAVAAVESDHVVAVHSVETLDGAGCIVMPLLRGQTLERRLADGPLASAEVRRIGRDIAAGLAAAHAKGLVHRDVKPANIWLEEPGGRAKVLDFGVAVAAEEGEGGLAGTPGYMAPEQVCGEPADARGDLFSLGCVLYRCLAGRPPFPGGSTVSAVVRTLGDTPPAPPGDQALARLVLRLMAKERAGRPPSAAAVVAEFDRLSAAITRRRWVAGLTVAAVVGGLAAWWLTPGMPPPAPPVKVAVESDVEVVFVRDGREATVADGVAELVPGEYRLRPATPAPGRRLVPDTFAVTPTAGRLRVALVGEVAQVSAHAQRVVGVAVGPGGVLSAGADRLLCAWKVGEKDVRSVPLASPALGFAATPDGTLAVTAGGNRMPPVEAGVSLWDGRTLEPRGEPLAGHRRLVTAVAIAPDGQRVVSATADEVLLWDVARRESVPLAGHAENEKVTAAAFSTDGTRALTADETGRVIVWDVAGAKRVRVVEVGGAIRAVAFVAGGVVTAGDDGIVRVWDDKADRPRSFPPVKGAIRAMAVSAGRLLTGGEDGVVRLWSVADGVGLEALTGHRGEVTAVAFGPGNRDAVSGGADRTVRAWRLPFE